MSKKDESAPLGIGGCYEVGRDGVRRMVSPGTVPHADGDGPREADGRRIYDAHETPPEPDAKVAPDATAGKSRSLTVVPE